MNSAYYAKEFFGLKTSEKFKDLLNRQVTLKECRPDNPITLRGRIVSCSKNAGTRKNTIVRLKINYTWGIENCLVNLSFSFENYRENKKTHFISLEKGCTKKFKVEHVSGMTHPAVR